MNAKSKTSKAALLTVLLSSVFVIGCDRRSADDQAAAESGAAGTSATDTTTAARADSAGSAGTSSSGGSATSGASDSSSPSAASGSTDAPANTAAGTSDSASGSSGSASGASDQSSGASGDSASKSGAVVDDSVITTKLKAALLADSEIKGTDVSVDTKQGEVTLTGSVQNKSQKERIQTIAKGIDGVKNVQDKLTVKQ